MCHAVATQIIHNKACGNAPLTKVITAENTYTGHTEAHCIARMLPTQAPSNTTSTEQTDQLRLRSS